MLLADVRETINLVFSRVDLDSILEVISELPDQTDYSLAISIVSNYIAKEVKDVAVLQELYSSKAYFIEKCLEQYAFEVLIDNGHEPNKVLNKFKNKAVMVVETNNPVAEKESFFKPTPIAEESVFTQKYKGYKLYESSNDLATRIFQVQKSNKVLEIKEVPDELLKVYRELLTHEMYDPKNGEGLEAYHNRLDSMVEEIKELGGMKFRNWNKQAGARNYSLMRYITGNKFVKSLIQSSEYRTVSKSDIKLLKWWLYVNLQEKVIFSQFRSPMYSHAEAGKKIKLIEKSIADRSISIKKLGEYLRFKEAYYLIQSGIGTKTKFLPDFDGVNMGLVSFANSFRRKGSKLMNIANLDVSEAELKDNHTEMQELLELSDRDSAKKVNTPLLHGSAISTVANAVNMDLVTVHEKLGSKLGSDYMIPNTIASLGREYFKNFSDSIKVGHTEIKSYTQRTNVVVEHKGFKFTVVRDMPTLRGLPRSHVGENGKGVKVAKVNGYYAIAIHELDHLIMRDVYKNVDIDFDLFDAYYTWDYKNLVSVVTNANEKHKDYLYSKVKAMPKTKKMKAMFAKIPVPEDVPVKSAEWYILP